MEGYKDFLEDIKSKISNPLISSFIIGWIIWNWKIVLVLLVYDQNELPLEGAKSYLQFIQSNSSILTVAALPALTSLFYTFVFPYIRAWIKEFHTRIATKHESKVLELSKAGKMPIARYLLLKKDIDALNISIAQLHEEEAATKRANEQLEVNNNQLQTELNQLRDLGRMYETYSSIKTFDGTWDVTYVSNGNHLKSYWRINNGTVWEGKYEDERSYQLDHLIANAPNRNLILILSPIPPSDVEAKRKVFTFRFNSGFSHLEGQDLDRTTVILEKRKE